MSFFKEIFQPKPKNEELTQFFRLKQIIEESVEIINNTKSIKTAIGRFDTIKIMLERVFLIPNIENIISELKIGDKEIKTKEDIVFIDQARQKWIQDYFESRIQTELDKANALSNSKMRKKLFNKALNIALEALEYDKDNPETKKRITNIEQMITSIK